MKYQIPEAYPHKFQNGICHPLLYLWDAWSYVDNEMIHLYCLAVARLRPDGSLLNPLERNNVPFHIRHFSSSDDGLSWKDEGCFLKPQEVAQLNYRTIWSGSVKPLKNGKKLVAYTGLEAVDADHEYLQNMALGISDDGYHVRSIDESVLSSPKRDWQMIRDKGYYLDSPEHLGSNLGEQDGPIMSWRDPFVFYDKDDTLNLIWAAKDGPRSGVMARATLTPKGEFFEIKELYPPTSVPDGDQFTQLEVPKIVYDDSSQRYYLVIASSNRLYEEQPSDEVTKEIRLYVSSALGGPWKSLGAPILGPEHLFGLTILKTEFQNDRLLCMAPYTEAASPDKMLTFAPVFYIYLSTLEVEFVTPTNGNTSNDK